MFFIFFVLFVFFGITVEIVYELKMFPLILRYIEIL